MTYLPKIATNEFPKGIRLSDMDDQCRRSEQDSVEYLQRRGYTVAKETNEPSCNSDVIKIKIEIPKSFDRKIDISFSK
jgi:hypothetical protein